MAQLALAGVGAAALAAGALSFGLGTAAVLTAASIGFSAGNIAGSLLFPQKIANTVQDGSRLGDLAVTSSTYGLVQPIGVGHMRMAGNIIWATQIEETKTSATSSGSRGGKGGGKSRGGQVTQTTYTYAATFAVGLCQGPVTKVLKLWANNTLIYDQMAASVMQKAGLSFRFYPGDETQLPDSLIEADKGAGNVPAHRGLCYLVFDSLPLADFGNRIPNIQAEVAFEADVQQVPIFVTPTTPSTLGDRQMNTIALNPLRQRAYILNHTSGAAGITEFDLSTMAVIGEHKLSDITGDIGFDTATVNARARIYIAHDQNLYFTFDAYLYKINPFSWSMKWHGLLPPDGIYTNALGSQMTSLALMSDTGARTILVVRDGVYPSTLFFFDTQNEEWLDSATFSGGGGLTSGGPFALCPGKPGEGSGEAWAVGCETGGIHTRYLHIDRLRMSQFADIGLLGYSIENLTESASMLILDFADVDATMAGWHSAYISSWGVAYDETDDSLLILAPMIDGSNVTHNWALKWSQNAGLLWATKVSDNVLAANGIAFSQFSGGNFAHMYDRTLINLNSATGQIISSTDWSTALGSYYAAEPQAFDRDANALLMPSNTGDQWMKLLVDRATSSPATVAGMFTKICNAINIDASDYDVSDLTGLEIEGFMLSNRTNAADALRPLATLFQIDAVEQDYKLYFRQRGGSPVASITEDEMLRSDKTSQTPEPYAESRTQEIDLPAKMTVSYIDTGSDFQINTQAAKRVRNPTATVFTDQQIDLQVGLAMSADTARQHAETLLYAAWIGRHTLSFMLPPDYCYLDAGDVVHVTLANGYSFRGRLGATETGANYALSTTIYAENDGQYVSTASGQAYAGTLQHSIAAAYPSQLFLLDVPLLRDTDDIQLQGMKVYWAAAPFLDVPWPGAQLQGSYDQVAWDGLDVTTHAATWGFIEDALIDGNDTFHTHMEQSITVHMTVGGDELESVTETQLANGYNGAAVFKANGEIEIIQFLTITHLGSGRYRLSGLNRGCRGTDTMANDHAVGERILMISTYTVFPFAVPLAYYNTMGFYRAVTGGTLGNTAIPDGQVFHARDKKPYAPVHVAAAISGSDVVLTWNRRARVNGTLHDSDGAVPVGESSEAYEVDIYDAGGTTVLRTLTGISSETTTYLAADITADFGSIPSTIDVAVYQISSTAGRGFGRIDLIGVA